MPRVVRRMSGTRIKTEKTVIPKVTPSQGSCFIVTNNPRVSPVVSWGNGICHQHEVREVGGKGCSPTGQLEVLLEARRLVHLGHKLLTHPMAGGIGPRQTPYRTVILSQEQGPLDLASLREIEGAVGFAAEHSRYPPRDFSSAERADGKGNGGQAPVREHDLDLQLLDLELVKRSLIDLGTTDAKGVRDL